MRSKSTPEEKCLFSADFPRQRGWDRKTCAFASAQLKRAQMGSDPFSRFWCTKDCQTFSPVKLALAKGLALCAICVYVNKEAVVEAA